MRLDDVERRILASCEALFPRVVEFTKSMVRQYAVRGAEQGVLTLVETHLTELGLPVERISMERARLSRHRLYAPVEWDHEKKYNLVSKLAAGAAGRSLALNGHLDVVPAESSAAWTQPPSSPWEQDGWLYGRGAGDMQSGVAAMIYAVHAIRHAGYRISSPLTLQCVVEEECSGNGTLACLERGCDADFVLIPEPLGQQIQIAQVGVLWFKIVAHGRPVHVLETSSGSNAIEKLISLILPLKELERQLNDAERAPPYDRVRHPFNLNIGTIRGGDWPSSVPGYAEMECRLGYPPGMTSAQLMSRVKEVIDAAIASDPESWQLAPQLSFHGFRSDGHLVDLEHPGIRLLSTCHEHLTGQPIRQAACTATTDLRAFHFHGSVRGTCYGPTAENIHGIDERVDLESIRQTLYTYALFICRWSGIEADLPNGPAGPHAQQPT